MSRRDLPDDISHLPLHIQVAVLDERVKNLDERVRNLTRALWAAFSSVVVGMFLYLLSVAEGWLGPAKASLGEVMGWVAHAPFFWPQ